MYKKCEEYAFFKWKHLFMEAINKYCHSWDIILFLFYLKVYYENFGAIGFIVHVTYQLLYVISCRVCFSTSLVLFK